MKRDKCHKENLLWQEFINYFNQYSEWDIIDLRLHQLLLLYKGESYLKGKKTINRFKKEIRENIIFDPLIFKSIESYECRNKIYNLEIYTFYLDIHSKEYLKALKNFFKNSNIKICLNNNFNLIILYDDLLMSIRKRYSSKNLLNCNLSNIGYFHSLYIKSIRINQFINRYFLKIINLRLLKKFLYNKFKFLLCKILINLSFIKLSKKIRYRKLKEEEFLNLEYLDNNELNFILRRRHFDIILNGGKLKKIKDIVKWFSIEKNILKSMKLISEPEKILLKNLPRHLDRNFWENGNSQFFNCMIYGFRKKIVSYEKISSIIDNKNRIYFSGDYYNSLPIMSDIEIENMLNENPIIIKDNKYVASGRHRVAAMIGRLIKGEKYIPFIIENFN